MVDVCHCRGDRLQPLQAVRGQKRTHTPDTLPTVTFNLEADLFIHNDLTFFLGFTALRNIAVVVEQAGLYAHALPVHDQGVQRGLPGLVWAPTVAHRPIALLHLTAGAALLHGIQHRAA